MGKKISLGSKEPSSENISCCKSVFLMFLIYFCSRLSPQALSVTKMSLLTSLSLLYWKIKQIRNSNIKAKWLLLIHKFETARRLLCYSFEN